MGFKQNLLDKIRIDQLTARVGPVTGRHRAGRAPSPRSRGHAEMLEMGAFEHHRERDLDLYLFSGKNGESLILLPDNELKIYRTTIEDVALRKSPTVKEMVSIRNAIKILNDKDVVISSKTQTLERIHDDLVAGLDLSFTAGRHRGPCPGGPGCPGKQICRRR